jgi:hypothetical protein
VTEWKRLTAAEFSALLDAYPRPLREDINRLGEPPMMTWNDFTRGAWPSCEVARNKEGSDAFYVLADPDAPYVPTPFRADPRVADYAISPRALVITIAPNGEQTHNYRRMP